MKKVLLGMALLFASMSLGIGAEASEGVISEQQLAQAHQIAAEKTADTVVLPNRQRAVGNVVSVADGLSIKSSFKTQRMS